MEFLEIMEALDPLDLMVDRDKREREAHPVALESQESRVVLVMLELLD